MGIGPAMAGMRERKQYNRVGRVYFGVLVQDSTRLSTKIVKAFLGFPVGLFGRAAAAFGWVL